MELFTNTSRERFSTIAENFADYIIENRGSGSVEDVVSAFSNAGFTKSEFFQILDKYYLKDYSWAEEPEANTKSEEVSVGDSDRAILETALTQIGINYEHHGTCNGINWIEIKDSNNCGIEVYFEPNGNYREILC